jgi:hypothetical protein
LGSPLLSREKWNRHHEPCGSKRWVAHSHVDESGDAGRTATGTVARGSTITRDPIPSIPPVEGGRRLVKGVDKADALREGV